MTINLARALAAPIALAALTPANPALACACGCGIFDVGTVTPQSSDSGLSMFLRFNHMDQDQNREGGHAASPDDNSDKRITTSFYTLGVNYVVHNRWTLMAELPLFDRHFRTLAQDDAGNTAARTFPLTAPGDAVLTATYAGFAPDMSTGLGVGIKLPTGQSHSPTYPGYTLNPPYDRDTLPGTGSTDLQVQAYHVGHFGQAGHWFAQAQYRFAVAERDHYRPGNELNAGLGVSYSLPAVGHVVFAPGVTLLASMRAHDSGDNADPLNSGYRRLLVAPGLRVALSRRLSFYGDVEFPVAQYANAAASPAIEGTAGQLAAPAVFMLQMNYGF